MGRLRHIQANTRIPVMGHADGVCHVYVDESADLEMARDIIVNGKTQRPSVCNAVESLVVHEAVAGALLADLDGDLADVEEAIEEEINDD